MNATSSDFLDIVFVIIFFLIFLLVRKIPLFREIFWNRGKRTALNVLNNLFPKCVFTNDLWKVKKRGYFTRESSRKKLLIAYPSQFRADAERQQQSAEYNLLIKEG